MKIKMSEVRRYLLSAFLLLIVALIPNLFVFMGDQLIIYLQSQHPNYIYMFNAVVVSAWVKSIIMVGSSIVFFVLFIVFSICNSLKIPAFILIIIFALNVIINISPGHIEQDGVEFVSLKSHYTTQKIFWTEASDVTLDIDYSTGSKGSVGTSHGTLNIKSNNKSVGMVFVIERTRKDEWENLIKILSLLQQNGIPIRLTSSNDFGHVDKALLAKLRTFTS